MTCIWTRYEEEFGSENVKNKSFRYPPIIPIVYYEGKAEWTAGISIPSENMDDILDNSPQRVIDILVSVIRTLCKRIHATPEEAEGIVEKVRSGNMGYLFENMEPMDIQAERRKTAQARAELEAINQKLSGAKEELSETSEKLSETKEELAEAQNALSEKTARIIELENLLRLHNIKE